VVRERLRERAIRFRERIATAIEVDVTRLLERLRDGKGELLAESAADLEHLAKLDFQLVEQPLSERFEHAVHDARPLALRSSGVELRRRAKKDDLVAGTYTLPALDGETTVAVKIIDMLGEEVLVTERV